jgi:hypothetical protein
VQDEWKDLEWQITRPSLEWRLTASPVDGSVVFERPPMLIWLAGIIVLAAILFLVAIDQDRGGFRRISGTLVTVSGDLDGLDLEGEGGEYSLVHATGSRVELGVLDPPPGVSEGAPVSADLDTNEVVLWVQCS